MKRRVRQALVVVGVGVGLTAIFALVLVRRGAMYPIDADAQDRVENMAPLVRERFLADGACPSIDEVERLFVEHVGEGLCPGGGVPDVPCIDYFDAAERLGDCVLRYSAGFDGYHYYLTVRHEWFDPEQFADLLTESGQ